MTSFKQVAACLLALAGCGGLAYRGISDSIDSKADAQSVVAAPQECHGQNQAVDPLPDFVESDSDQLTELNKFDGPIEGDANWAIDEPPVKTAGDGDDATEPQDAAPAVVDDYGRVRWVSQGDANPLAPTMTIYTRPHNCTLCQKLDHLFAEREVVKQTRAWNCRVVILTSNSPAPYIRFRSPANSEHVVSMEFEGCPDTTYALAKLLYETWPKVMPPPEKSVVTGRRRLLPSLRGQR